MATYIQRKGPTGATSYLAQIRLPGFKPVARTFRVDKTTPMKKASNGKRVPVAAIEWAEALETELRDQAARGTPKADLPNLTVASLLKEYLAEPEVRAKKSFTEIQRLVDWWTNEYGGIKVFDIGVQLLRESRKKLSSGRQAATVNRHLSQMRAAWNWGIAAEYIPASRPWPKKLLLAEPKGRTRFLSDTEMSAVLTEIGKADADPVMRALVVVSIATGMRQGEVRNLKWADVDLEGSMATTRDTKNGESRVVHLGASAVAQIKALRKLPIVSTTAVFVGSDGEAITKDAINGRWRKIVKATGLKDFRWHDLRHTNASILLQGGTTLAQLGKLLGHKSPGMTSRYAHLVPGAALPAHAKIEEKLGGKQ